MTTHQGKSDDTLGGSKPLRNRLRDAGTVLRGDDLVRRADLAKARARIKRLTERLDAAEAQGSRLRRELRATRESLRDPFPAVQLTEQVTRTIQAVQDRRLTYLKPRDLESLARLVLHVEQTAQPGLLVEAGTALGGSALTLASAKFPDRLMKVYDLFGMPPPPSERDGKAALEQYAVVTRGDALGLGEDAYFGYRENLLDEVKTSFHELDLALDANGVELIPGAFESTLEVDQPVALAHIDVDWFDSTLVGLERIAPHLVPGGRMIVSQYYSSKGCRAAVDQYVAFRPQYVVERRQRVHVVRL